LPEFWPEPPAAMPEDHIASPQFFQGALAQKCFSNSICKLLKLVNSVENRRKIKKCKLNFVGFVVKILQLLLYSDGLILDIFSTKNRNVKTPRSAISQNL
jgi:hypothetical protein